jgi:hypothetical protein
MWRFVLVWERYFKLQALFHVLQLSTYLVLGGRLLRTKKRKLSPGITGQSAFCVRFVSLEATLRHSGLAWVSVAPTYGIFNAAKYERPPLRAAIGIYQASSE